MEDLKLPPPAKLAVSVRDVDIDFEVFADRRAGLKARLVDRNAAGKSVVRAILQLLGSCRLPRARS